MPFLGGMPFGRAPEVPPEFRPLPMTQAMLEFAAPIMAYVENGTVQDPNDALQWEEDFFALQELCCHRYHHWLQAKGVPETYSHHFPFCVETYLSFIYQYDAGKLQDVAPYAIAEFFMDYLLRKVMVKPPEYTHWPPALRLFYRFLAEKGSLDDPEPMIERLHAIEPDFIALVKQHS
jgi:hypothetical protein